MSVAVKFKEDDEEKLLQNPVNKYLRALKEMPQKKYDIFKDHDPFPLVPDALLNSFDIVRYVYTTGMIYPFYPESLEGAVYTCNFSGYYKYWDKNHEPQEGTLGDSDVLRLHRNSISFLEIEPTFRIPTYLVLRFNLKVQHVYKGLLLGTGPIVDPGFVGKLYIPLHNLTSNEYIIKKDAPLICVEFTKLSNHNDRNLTKQQEQIIKSLDFNTVPIIINSFEPSRGIDKYIYKSLTNEKFKKTRTDELSVESSIPEAIMKAEKNAMIAVENARKAERDARKAEKNASNIKSSIYRFGLIALIAIIIAIATLVINIFSLIDGVNARIDKMTSDYFRLTQENNKTQGDNKKLKDKIDNLQSIINSIQETEKDKNTVLRPSDNSN